MEWEFEDGEECFVINMTSMKVEKTRARHSLRGRICEEELYETHGGRKGWYRRLYKTYGKALEGLKSILHYQVVEGQRRLQELESEHCTEEKSTSHG